MQMQYDAYWIILIQHLKFYEPQLHLSLLKSAVKKEQGLAKGCSKRGELVSGHGSVG